MTERIADEWGAQEALQFGHDSSPWMTNRPAIDGDGGAGASIRPRLIAVDDAGTAASKAAIAASLQFGHDSSPWMTSPLLRRPYGGAYASIRPRLIAVDDLQFAPHAVRLGHASIRPRLIAVDDLLL